MSKPANWPLRITVILVVVLISLVFAVALWYGLAYLGMTAIISIDYLTHPLSWMGVGPAGAWLILGCFTGAVIGGAKALSGLNRKSEARKLIGLACVVGIFFWTISLGATAMVEKQASTKAAAERVAQEEAVRRQAREAEEKATLDKAWSEGRLWQITSITNQTTGNIPFQILNGNGSWDDYWVKPGASVTVSAKVRDMIIKFDYNYSDGYQEKKYTLSSTPVIGHEPTKKDSARAKANSFRRNGNEFDIYQN
jgi:hypothetical protein